MNKKGSFILGSFALLLASAFCLAATPAKPMEKIAVVSMRSCLENSEFGKSEKARLEALSKQMQETIEAKEKELNEMAPKLKEDYLETLSPEAEKELKTKFQNTSQEVSLMQNQYYQLLNQMQGQVIQKLHDFVQKASAKVAAEKKFDLVLTDEVALYFAHSLDISDEVTKEVDVLSKEEEKTKAEEAKKEVK